jgi:phage tail tube protein FII
MSDSVGMDKLKTKIQQQGLPKTLIGKLYLVLYVVAISTKEIMQFKKQFFNKNRKKMKKYNIDMEKLTKKIDNIKKKIGELEGLDY